MIFTIADLIKHQRDKLNTCSEAYGRRVSMGTMERERADTLLAAETAILSALQAINALLTDCDRNIILPRSHPEHVPASQSQQIALRAQIQKLKELGFDYEQSAALCLEITGVRHRHELDSAQAAKLVSCYEGKVNELEAEGARMDGRMSEAPNEVPF